MTVRTDRRIVHVPEYRERPDVVVYGIAHAGAGAAPWNPVAHALPPGIDLRAIRLPGRENRINVPGYVDLAGASEEIGAAIEAQPLPPGRRRFLVGSCFGALVATAVAARIPVDGLIAVRQPVPAQRVVGGVEPGKMDSEQLRAWVLEGRMTPPALVEERHFRFYEPALRADVGIVAGYVVPKQSLTCPVHIVDCPFAISEPDLGWWAEATSGPVDTVRLDIEGDPLTDSPDALARTIAEIVSGGAAGPEPDVTADEGSGR